MSDRGLTPGQFDRFAAWLAEQSEEADRQAEAAVPGSPSWSLYQARWTAFRDAERALRVAQVGALPLATEAASALTETPQTFAATSTGTWAVTGMEFWFTCKETDRSLSTFCRLTLTSVGMLPEPPVLPPVAPDPPVVPPVVVPVSPVVPSAVAEPESPALAGVVSLCVLQAASIVADATRPARIHDLVILNAPESY